MEERIQQILNENGLNWGLNKKPMTYVHDGSTFISNKSSLIRTDNGRELNVVGKGYVPMENETMVEASLKASSNYGELSLLEAGEYNNGKKVYIKFKIKGIANVGNENIERYITLLNANDGTGGFKFAIGNMVMSCENQFHSFPEGARLSSRHSKKLETIISTLDKYIDRALNVEMKLINQFRYFNSHAVSRELAERLVKTIITKEFSLNEGKKLSTRMKNKEKMFLSAIDLEMKNKGQNAFGLFNGITYATNHLMGGSPNLITGNKQKINEDAFKFISNELSILV